MNKKGEISMNVIIAAAIALIVLVVLILIFTGRIHLFTTEVNSCTNSGGSCVDLANYGTSDAACKAWGGDYSKSMTAVCTKTVNNQQVTVASKVCCIAATK